MTDFDLQQLWQKEIQILDEIDRICKKHNITYYLVWGTLLGSIRHKGFIPWDDDIDIGMPIKSYKKFLRVAKKELSDEYFLQTGLTDKWHPVAFAKVRMNNTAFYPAGDKNIKRHHGIFVDIFPMNRRNGKRGILNRVGDRISGHIAQRRNEVPLTVFRAFRIFPTNFLVRIRDLLLQGRGDYYLCDGALFRASDFEFSVNGEFEGKQYPIPQNYHEVLEATYGDYMQLPPEENRVAHAPAFISFDLKKDKEKLEKYLDLLKRGEF